MGLYMKKTGRDQKPIFSVLLYIIFFHFFINLKKKVGF